MKKALSILVAAVIFASCFFVSGCFVITDDTPDVVAALLPPNTIDFRNRNPDSSERTAIDYSTAKAGDVLLESGKFCNYSSFDKNSMKAVGVIFRAASDSECAMAIGLYEEDNKPWCKDFAKGYIYGVSDLNYSRGSTDSKSAYLILERNCSDADISGYYPAWEYCKNYGFYKNYDFPMKTGWYLPSMHELDSFNDVTTLNAVQRTLSELSKVYTGVKTLKVDSSEKTGSAGGKDKYTNSYYVTCNQNGRTEAVYHKLSASVFGDKYTGPSVNNTPQRFYVNNLIARPVYHLKNKK